LYALDWVGEKGFGLSTARERLKEIREYRRLSQADFGALLGVSQQAYGKKERAEADGFSPDDFEAILLKVEIDARWLFGQMPGPIETADLRISGGKNDAAEVHEIVTEYRTWKDSLSKKDALAQRLQSDEELRDCVEMLIENRGLVGRVIGYIESKTEWKTGQQERRKAIGELGR
jgi:transcriptional regulator with XRE-family HTH domain